MDNILQTSAIGFKDLFHKKYTIHVGHNQKELDIIFYFSAEHFHHLIGLHKLVDLPNISRQKQKKNFFRQVVDGKVSSASATDSKFYADISDRVSSFYKLNLLVNSLQAKDIVIKFNNNTANSTINAEILLYNSEVLLFLKNDPSKGENIYVPSSFFLREDKYLMRQEKYTILSVNINSVFQNIT